MRKKIVAGNWKMNCTLDEANKLTSEVVNMIKDETSKEHETILIPPFPLLSPVLNLIKDSGIKVGAQNCHDETSGAYTGEVSASLLSSMGISNVIIGHSERREYFHEDDALLAKKILKALEFNLQPIYCCGEKLEMREEDKHQEVVQKQVETALFGLSDDQLKHIIIAYEPVWAIGTGKTASNEQAQEMHQFIRKLLSSKYTQEIADQISILYGGSVKPGNAQGLFNEPDIDGGLIGGASLKSRDFVDILKAL
jgi:triosephosphate isomerase